MMPLSGSPFGRRSRFRRPRGPILALVIATAIVVPFVVRDLVRGDDVATGSEREVTTSDDVTTSTAPAATETTATTAAPAPGATVPPVTVVLDPKWVAKGWSRYSDSDEDTQSRINRNNMLGTTIPPPTTAPKPTTTVKGKGTTTTTAKPSKTEAPPTQAPVTAPPATTPATAPPTAPPATAPPATDPPPVVAPLVDPATPSG